MFKKNFKKMNFGYKGFFFFVLFKVGVNRLFFYFRWKGVGIFVECRGRGRVGWRFGSFKGYLWYFICGFKMGNGFNWRSWGRSGRREGRLLKCSVYFVVEVFFLYLSVKINKSKCRAEESRL